MLFFRTESHLEQITLRCKGYNNFLFSLLLHISVVSQITGFFLVPHALLLESTMEIATKVAARFPETYCCFYGDLQQLFGQKWHSSPIKYYAHPAHNILEVRFSSNLRGLFPLFISPPNCKYYNNIF